MLSSNEAQNESIYKKKKFKNEVLICMNDVYEMFSYLQAIAVRSYCICTGRYVLKINTCAV